MLKKLAPLFLVVLILGMFLPLITSAGYYSAFGEVKDGKGVGNPRDVCYEGIVPCGKNVVVCSEGDAKCRKCNPDAPGFDPMEPDKCSESDKICVNGVQQNMHCQLCHSFVMIDGIIDYVLINIIPYITVLMLVIGGVMFYFGGAKPELLGKSKTLFKGVIIGLVLIYGAYMIVGFFLTVLGAADINPIGEAFDADTGVFKVNCPIEITESD